VNGFLFQYLQKSLDIYLSSVNIHTSTTQRGNNTMTYEEAMEGYDVSAKQARAEVLAHGVDWAEFVEEVGSKSVYKSNEVLEWLGY